MQIQIFVPDAGKSWHYPSSRRLGPFRLLQVTQSSLTLPKAPAEEGRGETEGCGGRTPPGGYSIGLLGVEVRRVSRRLGENWLDNFTNHCCM